MQSWNVKFAGTYMTLKRVMTIGKFHRGRRFRLCLITGPAPCAIVISPAFYCWKTQIVNSAGQKLQQVFETIWQQRMQDMPIVNPALSVAVIGFEEKSAGQPGILLTPWCMNLVLLPEADEWNLLKPGSKQIHAFPSGKYEFVVADEPGLCLLQLPVQRR